MPLPDYTDLVLPPPPPGRPYVLVNMVMSADGKVVVEGNELGIGSDADRRLMRHLRANADVVLAGAGTLRATGTSPRLGDPALEAARRRRGKPPVPLAATLSASGNLPLDRAFFTAPDFEAVVYLSSPTGRTRQAVEQTGRRVVVLPEGDEAVPAMLRHLREQLGCQVLLCEGGPTLNAALFRAGAVDEYFVTVGPVIVGGRETLTPVAGARPFTRATLPALDLISAVPSLETGEVYCRYRVRRR